jgi:hypothetical protein
VDNLLTGFAPFFDAAPYQGDRPDSFVNHLQEMGDADTIRVYEWRGITRAGESLCDSEALGWMDFGCGLGVSVRGARAHGFPNVYGYDQGWGADWARDHAITHSPHGHLVPWSVASRVINRRYKLSDPRTSRTASCRS